MYQKDLNMSYLLDFYGEAIPQKHKEIMSQYYDEDLSLSEIAENFGISRQGARHLIKKGEEQLLFLEDKLGLAKLHKDTVKHISDFNSCMDMLGVAIEECSEKGKLHDLFTKAKQAAEKIEFN